MADIKLTGELSMDTSQGEASVDKFGKSVNKMARETAEAAKKAADAVGGISGKFDFSAEKITRNERSITESIKRTTTQFELLGKTASQKLEFKISTQGLDAAKFEPALQKLRELEAQAKRAGDAGEGMGRSFKKAGDDASGMSDVLRSITTGGIAAFLGGAVVQSAAAATKALYEASAAGERLRTMLNFASGGNGAKEIDYLRGVTDRLGLSFEGTAKAYGQFAAAAKGTALEGEKARNIFESVSKAAAVMGLSTEQSSGALLALQQMISKGTVQAEELRGQLGERLPGAFQIAAKAMGVTTAELGKMLETGQVVADDFLPKFAKALEENLGGAAEKAADRLDASVNRVDNAFARLKQTTGDSGVSKFMSGQYAILADGLDGVADAMEKAKTQGSGFAVQMFAAAGAAAQFINPLQAISYNAIQSGNALKQAEAEFAALKAQSDKQGYSIYFKSEMMVLSQYIAKLKEAQGAKANLTGVNPRDIPATQTRGASYARFEAEQETATKALNAERMKGAGITKEYIASIKTYQDALRSGIITEKEATTAVAELVKKQQEKAGTGRDVAKATNAGAAASRAAAEAERELKRAYDETLKSAQALADLRNKENDAIAAYMRGEEVARIATVKAANESVAAAQAEYDNYGKTKSQIAEVTLARLQDKLAGVNAGTEIAASIEREINAQTRLIDILRKGEVREAGVKAAEAASAEWQKTADSIRDGLTDSLFRAFESGKGFFKSLWDGIKNLFKTTVLKLAIQGVVGGVMGGTGGIASAASSLLGGGGGGGLGGLGNIASSLGSVGTVASQVIAGGMSIANALGTVAANVTGTGITGLLATNGAFGTAAAGAAGIGGSITAALGSIGPVGWAIIAAGAVAAILSGKKDSRFGSQYEYVAGSDTQIVGGPNKGVDFGGQMKAQDAVIGAINSLLTRAGSSQQVGNFASGFESSEKGKGFSYAGGTFANGTTFGQGATGLGFQNNRGSKTPEQAIAEYKDELIQATLQALQSASDLPKIIADQLKDVNIDALSGDALKNFAATIDKQITEVESFRTAVQGLPFAALRDLSFDAAAGLIAAGGGLEALSSKLGAYYENFYSEEERRAQTIASINTATAGSGLDAATATRESFRAIVEAQDLTTEAGRNTYASLIGVAGAFAGIAPAVELAVAAVETISDTLKSLRKESENLAVSLMRAQGNAPGADAAQYGIDTAGLSAVEKAVFDYNAGIKTQIETLNTATSSAADAASAALARQQAVQTERTGLQDQINGLTDTAAQALTRQRDALDESNRALFDNIQAVKTQQAAAAEALAAQQAAAAVALAAQQAETQRLAGVAQERTSLQDQLNALTDTAAQALTRQREALDESNRALFDNIQAVKAQKTAAAEAAEAIATAAAKLKEAAKTASALTLANATAGFSSAQAATNAAAEGIKQAIAAEKARIGVVRDAANQTRTQITGVFTLLRDQVEQLYGSVDSTQAQQAGQGGSFIAEALRSAQSGGGLPDQQKLQQAITAATGGLGDNNFATKIEAERARLLLAAQLAQLKDVAGDQLSESERAVKIAEDQLSALELQADSALQQYNALRGIDTSVLSVGGSIERLQATFITEIQAQGVLIAAVLGSLKTGAIGSAAAVEQIRSSGIKLPTEKRTSISTGAGTSQDVYASTGGAIGVYNQTGIDIYGKDGSSFTGAAAVAFIQEKLAANDPLAIYARAIEAGISAVSLDALAGFAPGTSNKFARENGLPEFRIGTNYVPQDMVAKIHEGEAIVPKAYNPAANGSSNAQLLQAVQALEEKMAQMIDAQERGNESSSSTAKVLQGQQTRPLLVEMAK